MLKNYIIVTLRSIRKDKWYSIINVLGLTIGFQSLKAAISNPVDALRNE